MTSQTDSWPICPDCSSQVNPGALKNVESILSLHRGKKACQDAAKKRNKTGKQRTIADMFSGVQKAKPKLPLVQSPKPVQSKAAHQALATPTTTSISTSMITSTAFSMIQHSQLLKNLHASIEQLPKSLVEASLDDELAVYATGDPPGGVTVDDKTELWETWDPILNRLLQRPSEDIVQLVKGGEFGIKSLYRVFAYLVKEGINEELLEGKVGRVITAISTCSEKSISPNIIQPLVPESNPLIPVYVSESPPIDVDELPNDILKDILPSQTPTIPSVSSSSQKCLGLAIKLPNGQSPHSAYPFSFHDQFGNPWDYSVCCGVLTIFSPSCGPVKHSKDVCKSCKALENDKRLQGILKCATDGIHENTPLAFHSLGSLQTINRQKQATIRGLCLGRLNDARKLV